MNDLDKIGLAIRHRRNDLAMTQEEVVARAGMDRGNYSEIENGKNNISVLTLKRIAEALETEDWKILKTAGTL